MAYTALYRNFRPLKFSDMVGQDHITKTLKNQIMAGRVGHAYLFSGGRGTGKTTSAKILSRAVNCLNPQNGEPCNECEICKEILDGSLTDVVEMDAASNNGVDDIRTIREAVNFLPTKAKYRVYIIDEVHMLSTGAFNALLKTLEEPPAHVKFILATTEPQKLPATILSRCQRFNFKKISEPDIIKMLKKICTDSQIKIDEEALKIIAVLSEGHMRDAISILERCSQESIETITVSDVKELVGLPSLEYINKIARAIIEKDEIAALSTLDDVINDGKDIQNFLWEVIKYFKDILVLKATNNLQVYTSKELEEIKKLADISENQQLLDIIYLLSDVENDIKWSAQKTIMLQVGIIKACKKETVGSTSATDNGGLELKKHIESLEQKLNALLKKYGPKTTIAMIEESKTDSEVKIPKEEDKKEKTGQTSFDSIDQSWKNVMNALKQNGKIRLYTSLINTKIHEVNDAVWEIQFPNGLTSFNEKILQDPINKKELIVEIFKATGKEVHLKYIDTKNKKNQEKIKEEPIKELGSDITIVD